MRGGEIIKQLRKNIGVSQKELAEKLFMTQQKLSRVEAGEQELDMMEFLVAFEVLGFATNDFWIMHLNYEEFEGYFQYAQIRNHLALGNLNEVRKTYAQLCENLLAKNPFMSQFMTFIGIKLSDESDIKKIDMLYQALALSIEQFCDEELIKHSLTYCETLIVNEIATLFAGQEKLDRAILLLNGIYKNKDNLRITPEERYKLFPYPMITLYQLLMKVGEYEYASEIGEYTLDYCGQSADFTWAPQVTYDVAVCYHMMGKDQEVYRPMIKVAYYTARAIEQHELAEKINKEYQLI